jgi:hypothetical protein
MKKKSRKPLKPFLIYGEKYAAKYEELPPELAGLCDKNEKTLLIDKDISEKHHMKTIVHEVSHGLLHESAIDTVVSSEVEELICMMNERLVDIFDMRLRK